MCSSILTLARMLTYGSDADLWCEVVLQAGLDALDADWGVCGLLIPNTAHGRKKHLDGCEA